MTDKRLLLVTSIFKPALFAILPANVEPPESANKSFPAPKSTSPIIDPAETKSESSPDPSLISPRMEGSVVAAV